jgi:predicted Rdx family selenoprotein
VRAASLAAELNQAGYDATIEEGSKGQYDVVTQGKVLFSKQAEGRFPELSDLLDRLPV